MGKPEGDSVALRFNFGKTARHKGGQFDPQKGDFVEREDEESSWTPVYIAVKHQVVGIVRNSEMGASPEQLAKKIAAHILNKCGWNSVHDVIIAPIAEPDSLIQLVNDAYAVTAVGFESTPPNPFDDNDFSKRIQKRVSDADGKRSKFFIFGDDLNKVLVNQTIKDESALGHSVQVRVRESKDTPTVIKKLQGIANIVLTKDASVNSVYEKLLRKYLEIRGRKDKDGE